MNRTAERALYQRKDDRTSTYFDFTLLFLVGFICAIGLIMIYSSSAYIAQRKGLPSTHFLTKQTKSILAGVLLMIIFRFLPLQWFTFRLPIRRYKVRLIQIIMLLMIILQIVVSFFLTTEKNGSTRWISVPIFRSFQPSEASKFVLILYAAFTFSSRPRALDSFLGFAIKSILPGILIFAIGKENLSAAIIASVIYLTICFVQSRKTLYFIIAAIVAPLVLYVYVSRSGNYRTERIEIWKNIETHEKGEQILQGLFAIASGGFFGSGLGNSAQKYGRVPEAYNDMVFTIICEELGLIGAFAVIFLFVMLVFRLFIISLNCNKQFHGLIVAGVMAQIAIQVILNIGVVTNLIPSTGITLPFISYGGSSVAVLLAEIGVVLNISSKIMYRGTGRRA